jgi:hypothetical protein
MLAPSRERVPVKVKKSNKERVLFDEVGKDLAVHEKSHFHKLLRRPDSVHLSL